MSSATVQYLVALAGAADSAAAAAAACCFFLFCFVYF